MSIEATNYSTHDDDWVVNNIFTDGRGLHLHISAETLKGAADLMALGKAVKRPVNAEGMAYEGGIFLWLTIPLAENRPNLSFGNAHSKRRKG